MEKKELSDYLIEATKQVPTITVDEAIKKLGDDNIQFVDVRDSQERIETGGIPSAIHVPRGILEFKLDERSPAHDKRFGQHKTFVFFCTSGGRSLLAAKTAIDMGLKNSISIQGGFKEWLANDGSTELS